MKLEQCRSDLVSDEIPRKQAALLDGCRECGNPPTGIPLSEYDKEWEDLVEGGDEELVRVMFGECQHQWVNLTPACSSGLDHNGCVGPCGCVCHDTISSPSP